MRALYAGVEAGSACQAARCRRSTRLEPNSPRSRRRGYSIDDEGVRVGVHCIGAPVFDARRRSSPASASAFRRPRSTSRRSSATATPCCASPRCCRTGSAAGRPPIDADAHQCRPSDDRSREAIREHDDIILETRKLTKEFKGFVAVDKVDLKVRRGTIHALIGPNGAGKTTCFNLLTKFLKPTSGQILFNGIDITGEAPAHIARRGIIRSFQISAVFPHLTVLENVRVALQRKLGTSFHFWRPESSLHKLDARALELLRAVDLEDYARIDSPPT